MLQHVSDSVVNMTYKPLRIHVELREPLARTKKAHDLGVVEPTRRLVFGLWDRWYECLVLILHIERYVREARVFDRSKVR